MIEGAIILFFVVLAWDLIADYRKWLKERVINHDREWWIRVALLVPSGVFFSWGHPWEMWIVAAAMMGFWWLTLFDGIFNLLRRDGFFAVVGTTGRIDRLQRKIGVIPSAAIKTAGCAATAIIYFLN
jgi:hypothetical protein